ncbi:MAG: esterase [Aquabacterium sp.]|nr:MAG: esterase [Aquabacterium sp.]
MNAPTHLLYLHGFRSSPQSAKAQLLGGAISQLQRQGHNLTWVCPQLPPSPADTLAELKALTLDWPREDMVVIGSSLGGFYATVLAEELDCRALLINPAVAPARDLARHIGEQTSFHNPADRFFFRPEFIAEFEAMDPYPITRPERYHVLVAEGDEVLDWREMVAHYLGTQLTVLPGNDHAISDFATRLPTVLGCLNLPTPKA